MSHFARFGQFEHNSPTTLFVALSIRSFWLISTPVSDTRLDNSQKTFARAPSLLDSSSLLRLTICLPPWLVLKAVNSPPSRFFVPLGSRQNTAQPKSDDTTKSVALSTCPIYNPTPTLASIYPIAPTYGDTVRKASTHDAPAKILIPTHKCPLNTPPVAHTKAPTSPTLPRAYTTIHIQNATIQK